MTIYLTTEQLAASVKRSARTIRRHVSEGWLKAEPKQRGVRGTREIATGVLSAAYPTSAIIYGTATAGDSGTATAGYSGTATAGENGVISIQYYDLKASRYKVMINYIGEGGLKAGVKYHLNDQAQFEEVK